MDQHAANWSHCLQHAALSDVGLRRANNQDAMATMVASTQQAWEDRGHLFLVADGMGAHAAGELASKLAADTIPLTYHKMANRSPPDAIRAALQDTNEQIHRRGEANPDFRGMGTTATTLLLLAQGAMVAHVGDSRAYRLRGNRLEQLTFDHSLVWEMKAVTKLPEDQVSDHLPKNIITRSLGPDPDVQIDLEGPFPLEVGDTFLLCTDGLSGQVEDEELGTILGCLEPKDAARSLVDLANLRGGPDNITLVIVRITGPQVAEPIAGPADKAQVVVSSRPVCPLLWALTGAFGLAALGLAALGYRLGALAGAVAAVLVGAAAVVQRYVRDRPNVPLEGPSLGRGPYSHSDCRANGQFVGKLSELVEQLRHAAAQEQWSVDWDGFAELERGAAAAGEAEDYAAAVRQSCQAISFMMNQLRQQHRSVGTTPAPEQPPKPSDETA